MSPIVRDSMAVNNLDLQRYVAPGDVATTHATDVKTNEYQSAIKPSLVQSPGNTNNKWLKDQALNPSHIEIRPTTLVSLQARDLEPNSEPNAVNCNSFGIRGGHRCQQMGDGIDIKSRLHKHHDRLHLTRRERNRKGFESHPCGPHVTGGGCSKIVEMRDTDVSQSLSSHDEVDDHTNRIQYTYSPPDRKGFKPPPCDPHVVTGGGCSRITEKRDTGDSQTLSNPGGDDTVGHDFHKDPLPESNAVDWEKLEQATLATEDYHLKTAEEVSRILHKHPKPFRTILGEHANAEEAKQALDAHHTVIHNRTRARETALAVGISVTVVVGVLFLVAIVLYLRRRAQKLASARRRVAELELELETRKGGNV